MILRPLVLASVVLFASSAVAEDGLVAIVGQTGGVVRLLSLDEETSQPVEVGELPAGIVAGPDGRTLYVTHPDRGRITVLDAVTKRPTASFAVKGQPFAAAATDEFVYVTDWTRNLVVKIDALSGATLAETPTGKAPAQIVLDKEGRRAFVAARESDSVSVVDVVEGKEVAQIAVGKAPFALALSPDGTRLYVGNVKSNDLSVIDVAEGREIKRVKVGRAPYGVAVTSDGKRIAVTLQSDDALALVDAATLEVTARPKVGSYPEGVAITPDDSHAVVANWFDDTVSVVDLASGLVSMTLKAEGGPRTLVALKP